MRSQRNAANQPPVVAHAIPDQSASEGTAFSFQFAANAFSDPDGDALTYAATLVGGGALPAWLTFTPATRTFSGTPGAGDFADLSIRVTATDPGGLSAHDDFLLAVNGKPVVANAIPDRSASEGTGFLFQFAANAFSDPDGDALTYAATLVGGGALPAWLTFTPATRTFSGTPGAGDFADLSIRVTATDPGGLSAHDDFLLAVNGKPVTTNAISNQNATASLAYSFQFASNTFSDPDGDSLTYSAALSSGSSLPTWLTFTPATRTFSGTPAHSDGGTITVRVTATDPGGLSVHDDFNLVTAALPTSNLAREYRFLAGAGQQLMDFSGNAQHGQLGSTSGSDTSDPSWGVSPARLDYDGVDDYVNLPTTGLPTGNTDLTVIIAGKTTADGFAWDFGANSYATRSVPHLRLRSTTIVFGSTGDDLTLTTALTPLNKNLAIAYRYNSATLTIRGDVLTTGENGSKVLASTPNWGSQHAYLGRYSGSRWTGPQYWAAFWSRRLSDTELAQAYTYVKAVMTARGVTV